MGKGTSDTKRSNAHTLDWNGNAWFAGNVTGTVSGEEVSLSSLKEFSTSEANRVKDELLNGAGDAYDTLKELGELIDNNKDAVDALTIVASNKADKEHIHDDRYYSEEEIDVKIAELKKLISDSIAQKSQVQIITWGVDD